MAKPVKIIRIGEDVLTIELGLMVSAMGTSLFYSAKLGSSAMATFCDGLHLVLHMSYGSANTLANAVLLIVLLLLDRSYINIGTILCVFTIGPWVDVFTSLLQRLGIAGMGMPVRVLCGLCGTALMGVGLGLYMAVDRGLGALEGIVKYSRRRFGLSVRAAKIIQDSVLVLAGVLMGANWGVGTVIGVLLTGPALQKSNQVFGGALGRFRAKQSGAGPNG